MVSVEINSIKEFMNKLLNSEAFDSFYLEEAVIATFNTFIIDGHLIKSDTDNFRTTPILPRSMARPQSKALDRLPPYFRHGSSSARLFFH